MITRERALELGIPKEWIDDKYLKKNDEETIKTQRCDDCKKVIKVHPDGRWRLKLVAIRCVECAQKLIDRGYDRFDSYFVE
jgi:hypothetical protein